MKKHLWTTFMLLLLVVGSTTASLGTFLNSDDGGAVIPVTKNGSIKMNFIIPKKYTKANQQLALPLEISLSTKNTIVSKIQTSSTVINLPDIELPKGTPYLITIQIGEYFTSKSAIW